MACTFLLSGITISPFLLSQTLNSSAPSSFSAEDHIINFLRKWKHSEENFHKLPHTYLHPTFVTFTLPPITMDELFVLLTKAQTWCIPLWLIQKIASSILHSLSYIQDPSHQHENKLRCYFPHLKNSPLLILFFPPTT